MSRIISISVTDTQYQQMQDLQISPTNVFRRAIDEKFNERYGAQANKKELQDNIVKINTRFNKLLELVEQKGIDINELIKLL